MSLQERLYSVLLVSASNRLNGGLLELLPPSQYDPIHTVGNVSAAKRALAEREFDFVLVNAPLPDDDGLRFAIDAGSKRNTVVLLMVRSEQYAETFDRSSAFGVFLMTKPLTRAGITLALHWMISARERLRTTEKKVLSVEEKMEEIRQVNRAKWLLIRELKMSEPDAHHYIEKQAMDQCVAKRRIAEKIIAMYG